MTRAARRRSPLWRRRSFFALLSGVPLAVGAWLLAGCVISPAPPPGSIDSLQRLDALDRPWPGIEQPLQISFDEHLIPSIHAGSEADAAYGLGLVHAHLRVVQMELFRRISQGRISESAGPFANSIDHAIRAIDLGRAVPEIERQLPQETRVWLERYVEGINDYLASVNTLPPEAKSLGLSLAEPWTVADVLTVGRLAGVDITWGRWLALLPKRNDTGFDDFIRRLHAFADAGRPSFGPDARQPLSALMDIGRTGSNAFVVHASRSATGGALAASDPHLGLVAPNAWCVVGYSYGDVSVVGLTLPGLPFVVVGRNNDIAWTGTNMQSVSSGLYALPTDFAPTETTQEPLRTRLWFDRTGDIRQTKIGPVISDASLFANLTDGDTALRWRGHTPSDESTAFLKVSVASTWDDFRSAFATYAVGGQNMLFADTKGNIGQILAIEAVPGAAMSARTGAASSDRAASDWEHTVPSTGLPFAFNPPYGFLVSANNTPVLLDPPLVPQGNTNDRLDRITALLSAHGDLDLDVLASIQRDTFSQASLTTSQAMAAMASGLDLDSDQRELIASIQQWDGHYEPSSRGAAAYQLLLSALIDALYTDRYSDGLQSMIRSGAYVHDFVAEDLRAPGSASSLEKALRSATRSWTNEMVWGDIHRLRLGHPIGLIPFLGSSYRFIDEPWPGSTTTVNKSAHAVTSDRHQTFFGANARLLIDMADLDASRVVLLGGQDGRVGSTAIIDQVPMWRDGRFIPLPLSREAQFLRAVRVVRIQPTAITNPERTTPSHRSEANP